MEAEQETRAARVRTWAGIQVTSLPLESGCILLVQAGQPLLSEIFGALEHAVLDAGLQNVTVLAGPPEMAISLATDEQMRALGWVRLRGDEEREGKGERVGVWE